MNTISEQVKELKKAASDFRGTKIGTIFSEAAYIVETLSYKLKTENMNGGKWISCSNPPNHTKEVLIFNGKSYSVGYYDGNEWVNAIHPVEWQEITHGSECETLGGKYYYNEQINSARLRW